MISAPAFGAGRSGDRSFSARVFVQDFTAYDPGDRDRPLLVQAALERAEPVAVGARAAPWSIGSALDQARAPTSTVPQS